MRKDWCSTVNIQVGKFHNFAVVDSPWNQQFLTMGLHGMFPQSLISQHNSHVETKLAI